MLRARVRTVCLASVVVLAACTGSGDGVTTTAGDASTGAGQSTGASTPADGGTGAATAVDTGAATGGGASETGASATTGNDLPAADPEPSAGCGTQTLPAGMHDGLTLQVGDTTRTYNLFVPEAHDGQVPVPLVFNFHGFGSNPTEQAFFSQMNETAAARGLAVVYPAGLDNAWNAGACCGTSLDNEVDDVGFVRALADAVGTSLCVDERRIYATGMSNGGFMSHRLACEASDLFAAVAPVAGVLGLAPADCTPSRVVPVFHTHGTADTLVPYDGGGATGAPSVQESTEGWVVRNGCDPEPTLTFNVDPVTCETWSGCGEAGQVVLCTAQGVGHCWPGQSFCPFGVSTTVFDASDAMADFFAAHPMRP